MTWTRFFMWREKGFALQHYVLCMFKYKYDTWDHIHINQFFSILFIYSFIFFENLYIFKLISKIEKIHLLYNIFQNHRNQKQWFYQKFQLLIWVEKFFLAIEYLFSITQFIVHVIIFFRLEKILLLIPLKL